MEKYFQTLTFTRPQTVKAWKRALRVQHGVGPEADYIINVWKEQESVYRNGHRHRGESPRWAEG